MYSKGAVYLIFVITKPFSDQSRTLPFTKCFYILIFLQGHEL